MSTSLAPLDNVGAVPPAKSTEAGKAIVLLPVPSCVTFKTKADTSPDDAGLDHVNVEMLCASVIVKTLPALISKVTEVPDVNATACSVIAAWKLDTPEKAPADIVLFVSVSVVFVPTSVVVAVGKSIKASEWLILLLAGTVA